MNRPEAPLDLTPEQADEWRAQVDALPADWFIRGSWPLLAQYCRHTVEARRIAQLIDQVCASPDLDIKAYGELLTMQRQETAALKALAASMRVSQQAQRTDGSAGTAARRGAKMMKRPWESD